MTEPMTSVELEELKNLHNNRGNVSYRSFVRMCDLIDRLLAEHDRLQSALEAEKKRSEAAIKDLPKYCRYCVHAEDSVTNGICADCMATTNSQLWQWRGPCAENTKGAGNEG